MGCFAQTGADSVFSLYLIGDAGELRLNEVSYRNVLRQQLLDDKGSQAIVFLGDNIYPKGMPAKGDKQRDEAERIINQQVDLVKSSKGNIYFIPGNHDWKRGRKDGYAYVLNQQHYADSLKSPHINFLPRNGCPGPVEIPLPAHAVLVIIDTQWILHPWEKPEGAESTCDCKSLDDILTQVHDILLRNEGKRAIIAAHHPIFSYGEHGGVFNLKQHLFPLTDVSENLYIPLPVIGSFYPLYRKVIGDIQDTAHPIYSAFRKSMVKLMEEFPGTVYASGHEHALQYALKDSVHYIGSGSGVKNTYVKKKGYSRYASSAIGFAKLMIYKNGEAALEYHAVNPDSASALVYRQSLGMIMPLKTRNTTRLPNEGRVSVRASSRYTHGRAYTRWLGKNYRDVWNKVIEVPVFDLASEKGGLAIIQRGGGMQTLSLRLKDSSNREYTLRSIEKFPEKAVPEIFKKTFAEDLVQDQISAAHPYGALVIPPLANAAGIYYTNPKLVYLPNDPKLGIYRKDFGNQLMLFEERPAGSAHDQRSFGYADKILSTDKVLEKLASDNDNQVDQKFVLRSRIFDLFIGDWDRHDDQWRWAVFKDGKGEYYRPIPRDRDQAFFVNEGTVPRIWSRKWALPKFQGFDEELDWPAGFMFNGRYFDRSFLSGVKKEDWIVLAEDLTSRMTDSVIESSIHAWPPEIFALHGETIIRKLKARRERLAAYALDYYLFLAREVDVVGSDKSEQFEVVRKPNGNVEVIVFKVNKKGETEKEHYKREFYPSETNEVRLYALGGDDRILLRGADDGAIKVRIIGGEGKDEINDQDNGNRKKTYVYDEKDDIQIHTDNAIQERISNDPAVNVYNRKAFAYNRLAPLVYGNFNMDDGLFIGGGFLLLKHGFRRDPYKSRHIFLGSYAINTSSFNFKYDGRFTQVVNKWSIDIDADLKSPNYVNNFFGFGNESVFDKKINERPDVNVEHSIQYYRLRFKQFDFNAKLFRKIGQAGFFKAGPAFQWMEIEDTKGKDRFIAEYEKTLSEPVIEVSKIFAGLVYDIGIDTRNNSVVTTNGVHVQQNTHVMAGVKASSHNYTSFNASLALYRSFKFPARVTMAVRAGGGINTGNYEIYQAQILDGKSELRGFRKTRFYGDRKFYTNAELRLKLASIRSYLFPASIGILGFYDFGRVWYSYNGKDTSAASGKSTVWHQGFGGGFWFTPFNLTVVSTEVGHSVEGTMAYLRLGFLF
jgi:hypothetical protein